MTKINRKVLITILIGLSLSIESLAQCRVLAEKLFAPQNRKVRLTAQVTNPNSTNQIIFFRTSLRVNTDGAPNSYHPFDLTGSEKAINNICNGISVSRVGPGGHKTKLSCLDARRIFKKFRDSGWRVPEGYTINWTNVIAAKAEDNRKVPCVFRDGLFKDYLGSLTSLKNDLPVTQKGECDVNDQLDQRIIPAFVMPGGSNPLRTFGAATGDLLVVFNPKNNILTAAIIGDVGPAGKLGEGSVGLNMALLNVSTQPKTYSEALRLDTGNNEMLVAILPTSKTFQLTQPFTKENITSRVKNWIARAGFATEGRFIDFIKQCDNN